MTTAFKFPELPRAAGGAQTADGGVKTMTKAELTEALFEKLGLNKARPRTWSIHIFFFAV